MKLQTKSISVSFSFFTYGTSWKLFLLTWRNFYYQICIISIHKGITLWAQDVNWTYIRHSKEVQDVFWTLYVHSICVMCLGGTHSLFEFHIGFAVDSCFVFFFSVVITEKFLRFCTFFDRLKSNLIEIKVQIPEISCYEIALL